MALPQEKRKYTFADHLQWDESERVELIDGEPFMQAVPHGATNLSVVKFFPTAFFFGRQGMPGISCAVCRLNSGVCVLGAPPPILTITSRRMQNVSKKKESFER